MDNPRLLTQAEQDRIADDPIGCMEVPTKLLREQDAKTAALVEAATFRAVGEALYGKRRIEWSTGGGYYVAVYQQEIEDLRAGKTPKGWERK